MIGPTTSGSRVGVAATIDDKGNLANAGCATSDFGEGCRFVIGTVSRDGVKTVNGKALPKE